MNDGKHWRGLWWMAVTPDEYETPLIVARTAKELSEKLGVNVNTVLSSASRNRSGRYSGRKIIRFKDFEEEQSYK